MFRPRSNFDPVTKIWSGPHQEPLYNPKICLGDVILHKLISHPSKIAQISDNNGVHLANFEIYMRSLQITKWLMEIGCQKNDIIGLIVRNSENVAPLAIAALLCGVPINSLDTSFTKSEITHMFKYTRPKFIFCDKDKYDDIKESLKILDLDGSKIYTVKDELSEVMSIEKVLKIVSPVDFDNFSLPKIEDGRNQIAFITCSSGTTGLPKGVSLSHSMVLQMSVAYNLIASDTILCFSSLFWLSGVLSLISGIISSCIRVITDAPFTPEDMLRIIEQYKVTIAFNPPSQMDMCLRCPDIEKRDFSSIRYLGCSGCSVPASLTAKMNKYLKNGIIGVAYGLSEIGGSCSADITQSKLGTVGKLLTNIKMRIVDDDGNNLGIGDHGEILIKTMSKFLGYYGYPEETEKVLDKDGWIHTNDIGYFDEDGDLFIVARKKEILKYKCYQISPLEVEGKVLEVPGVSQVLVCGIPDPIATDLPAALVIRSKDSAVTEEAIYDHVASQLSEYKQLRGGIYFVDSFPMTISGKYMRLLAKEIAIKLYNERN